MPDVQLACTIATRGADLADRCEAEGYLAIAATLRAAVTDMEEGILLLEPDIAGWKAGRGRSPAPVR